MDGESRIAFLTMDDTSGFYTYDELAIRPLAELGIAVDMVSWRDPDAVWSDYAMVVIRTPWDYQQDPARFFRVLEGIDASTRLENSLALCRWNVEKTYLMDLAERDVPIVPTVWSAGSPPRDPVFDELRAREIVIKPVVSANADDTYRLTGPEFDQRREELESLFGFRSWMAQPFMNSIVDEGEYSVFYFDGTYSHAVLKTPAEGDFRVQEEHGAAIRTVDPATALLAAADSTIGALAETPLYARADLVRGERDDWRLMELELIEPSLYFPYDDGAPGRFAEACAARIEVR